MNIHKWTAELLTVAEKQAHAAFKNTPLEKLHSNSEPAKKALDEKRDRLKAPCITRVATDKAKRK